MTAAAVASAFESAVRYAAVNDTLQALVEAAHAGEKRGDFLPHAVLADYLEEHPGSHLDDTMLKRLRSGGPDNRVYLFTVPGGTLHALSDADISQTLAAAGDMDHRFRPEFADAPHEIVHRHSPAGDEYPAQYLTTREVHALTRNGGIHHSVPFEAVRGAARSRRRRR